MGISSWAAKTPDYPDRHETAIRIVGGFISPKKKYPCLYFRISYLFVHR